MWKIVCGLAALALAWGGDAAAADVELVKVGNDPQNVWCDMNARQLAQGATLPVQILGRSKSDATVTGKVRMKSQTDKFEWASGEPTVTFTRTGSNPTSFGVKAKGTAPIGTYAIVFAAVDARTRESSSKSCSIEVILASRIIPPGLPRQGQLGDLPGGPGGLIGKESPGQSTAPPPFTVALSVNPASGATSITTITLRVVESGTPPPIKTCQYRVFPMAGGPEIRSDWVTGCLGWARTLAAGTYLLQVDYKFQMALGQQEFVTAAQLPNYVVAPAPVLNLPGTAPQQLAGTFSLKLGVAPASGQATSDTHLTLRLLKEGTWNPSSVACTYAAIPTGGGNPWSVGPDSTCALPSPTLGAGTYTIRLSYRYQRPDGSWGDGSSEVANYVVTPAPRVEVVSLSLDPLQPLAGQQATVRMTIKNAGTGPLPRIPWTIVKNNVGLRNGAQLNVPPAGQPGSIFEVTASFTAEAGQLGIAGYVDYANELHEPPSERGNNTRTLDVTVAPPLSAAPLLLEVSYVQEGPLGDVAESWVQVCNVNPDGAYYLYAKGRFAGTSGWEELASIPRAGDLPLSASSPSVHIGDSPPGASYTASYARDSTGWIKPCPSNLRFASRLHIKLRLGLGDCCTSITYKVTAGNRWGAPVSNTMNLSTPSSFFPCSPVPLCVREQ